MTLNASVVRMDVVEASRVEDRATRFLRHVGAARTVTPFATDVPFADGFGRDVVVH